MCVYKQIYVFNPAGNPLAYLRFLIKTSGINQQCMSILTSILLKEQTLWAELKCVDRDDVASCSEKMKSFQFKLFLVISCTASFKHFLNQPSTTMIEKKKQSWSRKIRLVKHKHTLTCSRDTRFNTKTPRFVLDIKITYS